MQLARQINSAVDLRRLSVECIFIFDAGIGKRSTAAVQRPADRCACEIDWSVRMEFARQINAAFDFRRLSVERILIINAGTSKRSTVAVQRPANRCTY